MLDIIFKFSSQYPELLISNDGKLIVNRLDGTVYTIKTMANGYNAIRYDGMYIPVHRLVALAYLGTPNCEFPVIDHLNMIKTDNRVENLEWVSNSENSRRGYVETRKFYDNVEWLRTEYGTKAFNEFVDSLRD